MNATKILAIVFHHAYISIGTHAHTTSRLLTSSPKSMIELFKQQRLGATLWYYQTVPHNMKVIDVANK